MIDRPNDFFRFGEITRKLHSYRDEYDRDYGRVLHAPSFRRLAHKTQLFPPGESDFFRTRLTHSLEVAEIAAEIGRKLQAEMDEQREDQAADSPESTFVIEPRVCEIAGLVHDLGHPPFGHNGERALNQCMVDAGGFEGNAQTLHILLRLEETDVPDVSSAKHMDSTEDAPAMDSRIGLNLTARSIAAALKYDQVIPLDSSEKLIKGYYACDQDRIDAVKRELLGRVPAEDTTFKTIECSVMDIADDIAYATYDLEDAFAGGFLNPLKMLSLDDSVFKRIASSLEKEYTQLYDTPLLPDMCREALHDVFSSIDATQTAALSRLIGEDPGALSALGVAAKVDHMSNLIASHNEYRTEQTSTMIDAFIHGVSLDYNAEFPLLSRAVLTREAWLTINVLKKLNYELIITSPMLRVAEYRGDDIVRQLFASIYESEGQLLPDLWQRAFKHGRRFPNEAKIRWEKRVVCDFVASMSDRVAVEFHRRMYAADGATIFKPL